MSRNIQQRRGSTLRLRTVALAIFGVTLVVGSLVLLWPRHEEDNAWAHITKSGVLRVGLDASYPPFEYLSPEGELIGFDIDLAEEIGHRLGLAVSYTNLGYDGLYDALLVNQVDALISALVITPEAQGRAAFTMPYFNAGQHLVTLDGSTISQMADLEGHALAVEYGSGGDVEARVWERRLADLTIIRYDNPENALQAVISDDADAALVDGISAQLGVGKYSQLRLSDNVTDELFGIAVRLDSHDLHQRLNNVLLEMRRDGTIGRLMEKWFGTEARW